MTGLGELLRQRAIDHPDAELLRFDGVSLSYREVDERSNQLAHVLATRGTRRWTWSAQPLNGAA